MSRFLLEDLVQFTAQVLIGSGVSAEVAGIVSDNLVSADAHGHSSHGVSLLGRYRKAVLAGDVQHGKIPSWHYAPQHTKIDGLRNFGQVGMRQVVAAVLHKLKLGVTAPFTFGLTNSYHVGRLHPYAQAIAKAGAAVIMCARVNGVYRVAPYGGIDARLGTNPIAYGLPNGDEPIVFDGSTAAIVESKVRLAAASNEQLTPGKLLDANGEPTTDPEQLYTNPAGAILPLGGVESGMLGSGLALFGELFAGAMLGAAAPPVTECASGSNDVFGIVLNPMVTRGDGNLQGGISATAEWIRSARPAPGGERVLLPGEHGAQCAADARVNGVELSASTVSMLDALAEELKLPRLVFGHAHAA